ncbi:MAG: pyrroloquinoline quinone biosynthesis protein PqqC [Bdellovibrio sp.]|nr:MAG: pyrroloquinoline quinone biosynthesis protein PqqC [Bdellovibrio sp.]
MASQVPPQHISTNAVSSVIASVPSLSQIDQLLEALRPFHLLSHKFYQDWMEGKITPRQLKTYATQYYHHVEAFPRYLSAVHSQTENPLARRILLENLNDEEGLSHGVPHPELWLQFAEGMGASRSEVQCSAQGPAIGQVIANFFTQARTSAARGLGALFSYEYQIPEIAESKIQGLRERYFVTDARSLAFFEVHREADVHHREALAKIISSIDPDEFKQETLPAAKETAQALWNFLTEMQAVA